MARTTAPALSMDATGTIGGLLTFRSTKGGGIAVGNVAPRGGETPRQIAQRATMRGMADVWARSPEINKDDWKALADAKRWTRWNAFLSTQLGQLSNMRPYSVLPDVNEPNPAGPMDNWFAYNEGLLIFANPICLEFPSNPFNILAKLYNFQAAGNPWWTVDLVTATLTEDAHFWIRAPKEGTDYYEQFSSRDGLTWAVNPWLLAVDSNGRVGPGRTVKEAQAALANRSKEQAVAHHHWPPKS